MLKISFNPPMLVAVLEGSKTVTRRRLSPLLPVQQDPGRYCFLRMTESGALFVDRQQSGRALAPVPCLFGQAGVIMRVQEAPECLLRVVGIQVEQVRSITEDQAQLEGIPHRQLPGCVQWGGFNSLYNSELQWYSSAVGAFQALFDTIYPAAWARNEWVWVVEFVRVVV